MKTQKLNTLLLSCAMALGSLNTAHAIDIQRWQTPQGSQVLLVERHDLPIVDYAVIFKGAGTTSDPDGKNNIAQATASLMLSGTDKYTENQINEKINDLAANMDGDSSFEYSQFGFRSLSKSSTLNATADLFNHVLTHPTFPQAALNRLKNQSIQSLKQNESYPGYITQRELTKLNYPNHPYGKSAYQTAEKIQAVQRQDLLDFHKNHYTQNQAIVAIVGDLTRPQAEALIQRTLANVPATSSLNDNFAAPPVVVTGGQRKNIPFTNSTQTNIQMGLPVLDAHHPDYFAMMVGNYILGGGGFDSRLMQELRNKHGYTYGARSSMSAYAQAAPFVISFSTERKNSTAALSAAQQVLRDFIQNGPTETELKQAKDHLTGSFPLRFDSNQKLLSNLLSVGIYQRPTDWFDTYNDKINNLTISDIQRAWQKNIQPEQLNIVVTGGN